MSHISVIKVQSNIHLLDTCSSVSYQEGKLTKDTFSIRVKKIFNNEFYKKETLKVVAYVTTLLSSLNIPKNLVFQLGNRVVTLYKKTSDKTIKKSIIILDRSLATIRNSHGYLLKENKKDFNTWKRYGFDEELFYKFSKFSKFLLDSKLASQIKTTKDSVQIIDNEPAIKVEGKFVKFVELKKRFDFRFSKKFQDVFVFEKESNEVFTYLDTGLGLVKHHPYLSGIKPSSKLTDEEYNKTLALAQKFSRESGNTKRKHILQIVSSYVPKDSWFGRTNLYDSFLTRYHPHIRIIDPDTKDVYTVGFWGFLGKRAFYGPLVTDVGRFRSPDIWEYRNSPKKIVTNIAIDRKEAKKLMHFCKKHMNGDINFGHRLAFNFMGQNCTSFTREAVKYATGIDIPTKGSFVELLSYITPTIFNQIGRYFMNIVLNVHRCVSVITPNIINSIFSHLATLIEKISKVFIAFGLSNLSLILGGLKGRIGRRIQNPDVNEEIHPHLKNPINWFRYSKYDIDCPLLLQLWQNKQNATYTFTNPKRFAIAPR